MTVLVDARKVCASYAGVAAVTDADLTVGEREVVALFGHNGAGKSTLLRTLFGIQRECSGEISFKALSVSRWSARRRTQAGMALVPQEQGVFPGLTVGEILRMGFWSVGLHGTRAKGELKRRLARIFEYLPVLSDRWTDLAGDLSGGQRQMVSVGRALMTNPSFLMLDEPSTGLAPNLVEDVMRLVIRLRDQEGMGVLLVEQNVEQALAVAGRVYLMKEGKIIREALPAEFSDQRALWSLF